MQAINNKKGHTTYSSSGMDFDLQVGTIQIISDALRDKLILLMYLRTNRDLEPVVIAICKIFKVFGQNTVCNQTKIALNR